MRNRRSRIVLKLIAVLILAGIVILAGYGYRFSRQLRTRKNTETAASAAEGGPGTADALNGRSDAENSASASDSRPASEETSDGTDPDEAARTGQMLSEQTKAANQKNAEILKGLISAAVPNVSRYASAARGEKKGGASRVVCLDPAHQASEMTETEAIGPGLDERSQQMTVGAQGTATGTYGYEINLQIALKLREELQRRGYTVVMTRESNDAELSEKQRTRTAFLSGADILVHITSESSEDTSLSGIQAIEPTYESPSLSNSLVSSSQALAEDLLGALVSQTGRPSLGTADGDGLTEMNWAEVPVTTIVLGYLSNAEDEQFLISAAGQSQTVTGLANGIDAWFASGGAGKTDQTADTGSGTEAAAG